MEQVFKRNRPGFKRDVAFLAAYSAASGAFGGLRSLCFSVRAYWSRSCGCGGVR